MRLFFLLPLFNFQELLLLQNFFLVRETLCFASWKVRPLHPCRAPVQLARLPAPAARAPRAWGRRRFRSYRDSGLSAKTSGHVGVGW